MNNINPLFVSNVDLSESDFRLPASSGLDYGGAGYASVVVDAPV